MNSQVPARVEKNTFDNDWIARIKKPEYKKLVKKLYEATADGWGYQLKAPLNEDKKSHLEHVLKLSGIIHFETIEEIAAAFRREDKKHTLIFAYNGVGKTRLSMAFKEQGKETIVDDEGNEATARDTLYFNAFTEDLFHWDNDLEGDEQRVLRMNPDSRFFDGLHELEMENRIRPLLGRYTDIDFFIDYGTWEITFFREKDATDAPIPIKVSRGEENIFVWCFFLAVAQLAVDQDEGSPYAWVKYLYIDDPISSLDDNNAIAVAGHLAQLLRSASEHIQTVISSHHHLFFNVICNELRKPAQYFLSKEADQFQLTYTGETPRFHHIALLKQLHEVAESGCIYTYHFNILRNILEKTATFHGYKHFSACIRQFSDDPDGSLRERMIQLFSHGSYSLFEPREMLQENKEHFRRILNDFMDTYRFNPELFPEPTPESVSA